MKVGFVAPQFGPEVDAGGFFALAARAEEIGYDSLWVVDRLLVPVAPKVPYPATPDGKLPEKCRRSLDPLVAMSFLAARTTRVRIGSCVVNLPHYNPVLLARQLTTIDVLSGGRLDVGIGVGWSPDEFEAAGVPFGGREKRADEALRLLKALWTENPVEFRGQHYQVPKSYVELKPIQRPHPPLYMAAFAPAAVERVARHGDGWLPAGLPVGVLAEMLAAIKTKARRAGRDPNALSMVVLGNVWLRREPLGKDRMPFSGSLEQIREDIAAIRATGAAELILSGQFSPGVQSVGHLIALMEQLHELAVAG